MVGRLSNLFEKVSDTLELLLRKTVTLKLHLKNSLSFDSPTRVNIDVTRFYAPYGKRSLEKYSWADADFRLERASFQILVDFVEKEELVASLEETAFSGTINDRGTVTKARKILSLYYWYIYEFCDNTYCATLDHEYRKTFNNQEFNVDLLFNGAKTEEEKRMVALSRKHVEMKSKYSDQRRKKMTEKLKELVEIRHYLWT